MIALADLLAAGVSLIFGAMVLNQYLSRKKPFQLAWSIALFMFGAASLAAALGSTLGWNPILAKTYYFFGAMIVVGYFALGTVYLLFSETAARIYLYVLLAMTAVSAALIIGAEVDTARLAPDQWEALIRTTAMKILTISLNTIGTIIIVGGAVYSAIKYFQKTGDLDRVISNGLIAGGVFIIASGGTLGGLFKVGGDASQALQSVFQAIGIAVMFAGFIKASQPPKERS